MQSEVLVSGLEPSLSCPIACALSQGSANCGPWANSNLLSGFANKVLLEHGSSQVLMCGLLLCLHPSGRGERLWQRLSDPCRTKAQSKMKIQGFMFIHYWELKNGDRGDLQDGGGVRHGDHLPSHKYIRNTCTCGTTPTEHPLNAGRRPQTS